MISDLKWASLQQTRCNMATTLPMAMRVSSCTFACSLGFTRREVRNPPMESRARRAGPSPMDEQGALLALEVGPFQGRLLEGQLGGASLVGPVRRRRPR